MQLFYDSNIRGHSKQFSLSKDESKHIVRVLRKTVGASLLITNGKGYIYTVKIIDPNEKKCIVEIIDEKKIHPNKHWLHMVVAPTKLNNRYEWFIEKATEIGVNEITPIICEKSERKVINNKRMQKVLLTAMKQSLRAYLPKLNEPVSFKKFIEKERSGLFFIAHCENGDKLELIRRVAADQDVTMLIGPEGDFSLKEIQLAYKKGYLPVTLGKSRLRTETAAIVACTIVNMINNG